MQLEEEADDISQQLVVFFVNASIGTLGGWGAKAVLQACRKVGGEAQQRQANRQGDCNAALNLQRAGESKWRPPELCRWQHRAAAPAKGKDYPALGFKKLRDRATKAQAQQPDAQSYRTPPALIAKLTTGASRQSSLAQDSTGERAKRLLAAANAYLKVKRGQPQPSMAAVAQEHCVPYATLRRVIKRGGVIAKRGRPAALSAVEEEPLRDLVVRGQQQGVGVTKTALLAAVRTTQRVTERKGKVDPFKGKAPGKKWRQNGFHPPDKDNMLAAAAASMEGGKQQPAFEPWVPLTVDAALFYFKHEVVAEAAKKAAKASKRSCK
ncbi:hypothetical protein QJQ45_013018 [Haematococcus lacustris]|nr:hypothetical protein QJQ45_013018 [Haematococcus lacustris]